MPEKKKKIIETDIAKFLIEKTYTKFNARKITSKKLDFNKQGHDFGDTYNACDRHLFILIAKMATENLSDNTTNKNITVFS